MLDDTSKINGDLAEYLRRLKAADLPANGAPGLYKDLRNLFATFELAQRIVGSAVSQLAERQNRLLPPPLEVKVQGEPRRINPESFLQDLVPISRKVFLALIRNESHSQKDLDSFSITNLSVHQRRELAVYLLAASNNIASVEFIFKRNESDGILLKEAISIFGDRENSKTISDFNKKVGTLILTAGLGLGIGADVSQTPRSIGHLIRPLLKNYQKKDIEEVLAEVENIALPKGQGKYFPAMLLKLDKSIPPLEEFAEKELGIIAYALRGFKKTCQDICYHKDSESRVLIGKIKHRQILEPLINHLANIGFEVDVELFRTIAKRSPELSELTRIAATNLLKNRPLSLFKAAFFIYRTWIWPNSIFDLVKKVAGLTSRTLALKDSVIVES